jgi:phospholipid/cholesterol/gamma-HCH transport system substrate-binding protein
MIKVSNESKVGALAAIAITLLILGFNFLKGKNVFQKKSTNYVVFSKTEGLNISDPIKINGLRVGAVEAMTEKDADLTGIIVSFHLIRELNIPKDSYCKISSSPLGSGTIQITLGSSSEFLKDGDTIKGIDSKSMMENISESINPTIENVNRTINSLDSTIKKIGNIFDDNANRNISIMIKELSQSSTRLNAMLKPGAGSLAKTMENIEGITNNLEHNNDSITSLINNITKVSNDLSKAQLDKSIATLSSAAENLNLILGSIREGKGTMGMIMNDKKLYENLNGTANSLNILLQDFRLHPKRYVQFSVFGKKEKSQPLMTALPDSLNK